MPQEKFVDNPWTLGEKKDPGPELVRPESLIFCLFRGWKLGAEGRGRTDTGLPPPGFDLTFGLFYVPFKSFKKKLRVRLNCCGRNHSNRPDNLRPGMNVGGE